MEIKVEKIGLHADVIVAHWGIEHLTPLEAEALARKLQDAAKEARARNNKPVKFGDV